MIPICYSPSNQAVLPLEIRHLRPAVVQRHAWSADMLAYFCLRQLKLTIRWELAFISKLLERVGVFGMPAYSGRAAHSASVCRRTRPINGDSIEGGAHPPLDQQHREVPLAQATYPAKQLFQLVKVQPLPAAKQSHLKQT